MWAVETAASASTSSSSSCSSSYSGSFNSSSSSSGYGADSSFDSWSTFASSSSEATPLPPPVVHITRSPLLAVQPKNLKLLTDYSKKSCSDGRGTFQLGGSSSQHTSKSGSSGSLSYLPYLPRRFSLASSTTQLQHLMAKRGNGINLSSQNISHSSGGRASVMGTQTSTPAKRSLYDRLRRKKLFKALEQSLHTHNKPDDASSKDGKVTFMLKKNSGTSESVPPPPSLKASTSTPLYELLKDDRRKKLIELAEDPTSRLNKTSLLTAYKPVGAIGAKQRRASSIDERRAMAAAVAAAAAAKAATKVSSFHEGVRNFDRVEVEAALQETESEVDKNRPRLPGKRSYKKSLRRVLNALPKDEGKTSSRNMMSKRKQAMKRSASAPRNSLKSTSSDLTAPSKGEKNATREQERSEIAALQALAGGSSSSLFRHKKNTDIPEAIQLRRAASDESYLSKTTRRSPRFSSRKALKKSTSSDDPLPKTTLNRHGSMDSVVTKLSNKKAPTPVPHRSRRRNSMDRRGSPHDTTIIRDGCIGNLSSAVGKVGVRRFERASSFSSRKSLSLMVQNANLKEDKKKRSSNSSCDLTALTAAMDNSGGSNSSTGPSSMSDHRRRRVLQRAESAASRKSASSIASFNNSKPSSLIIEKAATFEGTADKMNAVRQNSMRKQKSFTGSRMLTLRD